MGTDDTATGDTAPGDAATGGSAPGGIGICCSGGGIRSAAFNLGALQSLDQAGVLGRARYLSAVSGGSYIASAFAIPSRYSDKAALEHTRAFAPGSPEESWVRNHCSYIANGFTDTVRVVAVALVGLLANLVFFTALLWTLARPLGWLYAWWQPGLRVSTDCTPGMSADMAVDAGCFEQVGLTGLGRWAVVSGGIALAGLVLALGVRMFQPGWPLRHLLRQVAVLMVAAGAFLALVTLVLPELIVFTRNVLGSGPETGPVATDTGVASSSDKGSANLGFVATVGGVTTIAAVLAQLAVAVRAARSGARAVGEATKRTRSLSRGLARLANLVLGALIGPLALAAAALFILNGGAQSASPSRGELLLWAAMAALTLVMSWFADVTSWSLHPFYKWRLARTFAVIRRVPPGHDGPLAGPGQAGQLPYQTHLKMSDLAPESFPLSEPGRPAFPELLVCASANVSDPGATPPGRSSVSFVFGPRTIGCPGPVVLARRPERWRQVMLPSTEVDTEVVPGFEKPTPAYEGQVGKRRRRDVTVSAAVAISGAAIAPAMGKMTRAPMRFLLALANVRLGVWLPNPANMPGNTPDALPDVPANPRQVRLLYEVMGRHRVRSKFLYVTDGGHVENLGLLELVRRQCATIVCLDAAGGSTTRFSTLGEAVALARSELDVDIDIDPARLGRKTDGLNAGDHVTGTIRYADGTRGTLIYGKALVTPDSPWDVRAYATKDDLFPVHPTTDQALGGETFDAYQALGRFVGSHCADVVRDEATAATAVADGGVPTTAGNGEAAAERPVPTLPSGVTDVRDVAAAASELS